MSKVDKLLAGVFVILDDYSRKQFPPVFPDQELAHQAEIDFGSSLPGLEEQAFNDLSLRKPFWDAETSARYLRDFSRLRSTLDKLSLSPPKRLLELGCGSGWMSEFLAQAGYTVVGTSIAPNEIALADRRRVSLEARGIDVNLRFITCPMEKVDQCVADEAPFDCVFVFEALHHAFDWREAIESAARCVGPSGWILIANEPNRLHTLISYRAAKLSNTHEIGLSRQQMVELMKKLGFSDVRLLKPRIDNRLSFHWIAARR